MPCDQLRKDYMFQHEFYHRGPDCPETYFYSQYGAAHQNNDDLTFSHVVWHEKGFPCDPLATFWIDPDGECWVDPDGLGWVAIPG